MKNATVMNEVQGIQKVLEEYLENHKAAEVAVALSVAMQGETQHAHGGEVFFVHKDEAGSLVLTMESESKAKVQAILNSYLDEDKVQKCLKQLMAEGILTEIERPAKIETILVEDSDSRIYSDLLNYTPANRDEERFLYNLGRAVKTGFKSFKVPVCNPLIDENGIIPFVAGNGSATYYSYKELQKLASKNGLCVGVKEEFFAYLATRIHRLIKEGRSESDAIFEVCNDYKYLGHYSITENGSVIYKVLADRDSDRFWIVANFYGKDHYIFAETYLCIRDDARYPASVVWFIFK